MLMFRELTPEERDKIDRLQYIKGQVSNLELQKLEKRKEIEFFEERKGMDYVPVIVWGLLFFSQIALIGLDLLFGWFDMSFNWAIIIASMTPVVGIFCGYFFVKSLREYIYRNSRNPKHMKKAAEKGIENRWMRSAKLYHDLEQINANLRVLKKEQNYLKLEVQKIEESEYQ